MSRVYVYSEGIAGIKEMIGAVNGAGLQISALAFSEETATALTQLPINEVIFFRGASQRAEQYAKAVAEYMEKEPGVLAIGSTVLGRELGACVSGYLACPMVNEALEMNLTGQDTEIKKTIYGGAVTQTEVMHGSAVVVLPLGKYEACGDGAGAVLTVVDAVADQRVQVEAVEQIQRESVNLADAGRVVSVGRGVANKEDMEMFYTLAKALNAEVACSRPVAEEKHWMGEERYVGITGTTLRPDLYLAVGISGQVQHMAGVRDAKVIVAINKDEAAPIFSKADYGVVGDMYSVVPKLIDALNGN